eukprot:gene30042-37193_t
MGLHCIEECSGGQVPRKDWKQHIVGGDNLPQTVLGLVNIVTLQQTRLNAMETKLSAVCEDCAALKVTVSTLNNKLNALDAATAAIKTATPVLTDLSLNICPSQSQSQYATEYLDAIKRSSTPPSSTLGRAVTTFPTPQHEPVAMGVPVAPRFASAGSRGVE